MTEDSEDLRRRVREVYSGVAESPEAQHPFRVGRAVAIQAGYPDTSLSAVPADTVVSFAGVSCLPCFAEVSKGSAVLDLGCGSGLDSLLLAPRAGSVVGVDFSRQMLDRARSSAELMHVTNVEFREGDAERIPAGTGAFDVAIVNGIFNLNPARNEIFLELARVVRRGGLVFAAELILKRPLTASERAIETDWFS